MFEHFIVPKIDKRMLKLDIRPARSEHESNYRAQLKSGRREEAAIRITNLGRLPKSLSVSVTDY